MEERLAIACVGRIVCRADAHGHDRTVGRGGERFDVRANALRDRGDGVRVDLREDDRELLSAVARREVDGAHGVANRLRDATKGLVAGEVAERVVVFLEAIEIEHEHAERRRVAIDSLELRVEALAEGAEVRQSGELVGARARLQLVGHAIERHAQRRDLVIARDRRTRGEISGCDAIRRGRELFDRLDDFSQGRLHRGETDEDENPCDRESARHHRARLALELRELSRDLLLARGNHVARFRHDRFRGRVDVLASRRALFDDRTKGAQATVQSAEVDAGERVITEELGDDAITLGRLLPREPARVIAVLRADQLFHHGNGFRLDGEKLRPSLLRPFRAPAKTERDREERHRECTGEEQDSRSQMLAAHVVRIPVYVILRAAQGDVGENAPVDLRSIYLETLARCAPDVLVQKHVDASMPRNVVAIGKCAGALLDGVARVIDIERAFVAIPEGYRLPVTRAEVHLGGHPQMTKASFDAGRALIEFVDTHDDILVLVSGGGSACVEVPLAPYTEDDVANANARLITSGLPIGTINTERRKLSAIKGGRLRDRVRGRCVTLVYSDVATGALADVASGPTIRQVSEAILVADNTTLVRTAAEIIGNEGVTLEEQIECDVEDAAAMLAERTPALQKGQVLVAGGEPTVVVRGEGKGGRCSELAVRFAEKCEYEALFASSDGVDGNSGAAGIHVRRRPEAAAPAGWADALEVSDSFRIASQVGEPIMIAPTGNNLRDLFLVARD